MTFVNILITLKMLIRNILLIKHCIIKKKRIFNVIFYIRNITNKLIIYSNALFNSRKQHLFFNSIVLI